MSNHINGSLIYEQPSGIDSAPAFFIGFLNKASDGAWVLVLTGLSFGIPYMALQGFNPRKAFAAASFNALVTVILLSVFGVVGSFLYTLAVVMVGIAVVINR